MSKRGGTAESIDRGASVESEGQPGQKRNVFKIGINCDAEQSFNKDPKDPNKYEAEGVKGQVNNV